MAITSVKVGSTNGSGGVEVFASSDYALLNSAVFALYAASPQLAITMDMQQRYPYFLRRQPQARTLEFEVKMLSGAADTRKSKYLALVAALRPSSLGALVEISWVDSATTRVYYVYAENMIAGSWFQTMAATLIAPNPDYTTL